ncbi:lytic transglycosylase domain-containing protein [Alloalcanivorax gelatiniphagus]
MTEATRRRWLVPGATLVLLVLGTAAVTLALALALTDGDAAPPAPAPPSTSAAAPAPAVPEDADGASATGVVDTPVSELADPDWTAATARSSGVPPRALAAYAGASLAAGEAHPGCGLGWNTLAAIGQVESEHGTLGGTAIDTSGVTGTPIVGVPLDGDAVAEVRDTDGGRLDGDPRWDRAVGPMQFIPASWEAYGTDGNADGVVDVHNIDDAALAAAEHLCATGGDLTLREGWIAAISAYNVGADYNRRVAEVATTYAETSAGP